MKFRQYSKDASGSDTAQAVWRDFAALRPIRILVRRRRQLCSCLLLAIIVTVISLLLHKETYLAEGRIEIGMEPPLVGGDVALTGADKENEIARCCQLLRSRSVLSQIVNKLHNLSGDKEWIDSNKSVKNLQKCLQISPVPGSRWIDIKSTAHSGPKAAAIVNQAMELFGKTLIAARRGVHEKISDRTMRQMNRYNKEVEAKKMAIDKFRQEHLITGIDSSVELSRGRIKQFETDLIQLQMQRLALKKKQSRLRNILDTGRGLGDDEVLLGEFESNQIIISLRQKLQQFIEDEAQLSRAYLPGHEKLQTVRLQKANIELQLLKEKHKVIGMMLKETFEQYASTFEQESVLKGLLHEQKVQTLELVDQQERYQDMLVELEAVKRLKSESSVLVRNLRMQWEMNDAPVTITESAQIPDGPMGLTKKRRAFSVFLVGAFFSVVFIFLLERFSMKTEDSPANQDVMFGAGATGNMQQRMKYAKYGDHAGR